MMRLFAVIVLVMAGAFSLAMVVVFSFVLAERHRPINLAADASVFARLLMFFAAIANAAIVLLYLLEWNC